MQNYEQNNIENFPPVSVPEQNSPGTLQKYSPDNPPWNWGAALGVWLISVFLLVAVPAIVVIPYMMSKGVNIQDAEGMKNFLLNDTGSVLLQIGLVIPIHVITLALSWAVVTNFKKFSFREMLGWEWGGFKIWHIALIIISFFLLAFAMTKIFGEQENELTKILKSSRTAVYLVAFMATFTAPIVEEVVYRGIIYSAFQRKFGIGAAVVITTILFAGVHYFQYWGDVTALTMVTLLSLTLTMVRVKTGNLLPCIVLHTVFNGIQSFLLIIEPFLQDQIKQNTDQTAFFFHLLK